MDKHINYIYLYRLQVEFYNDRYKGSEGRIS